MATGMAGQGRWWRQERGAPSPPRGALRRFCCLLSFPLVAAMAGEARVEVVTVVVMLVMVVALLVVVATVSVVMVEAAEDDTVEETAVEVMVEVMVATTEGRMAAA